MGFLNTNKTVQWMLLVAVLFSLMSLQECHPCRSRSKMRSSEERDEGWDRQKKEMNMNDGMMYLMKYGYVRQKDLDGKHKWEEKMLQNALKKFQHRAHVPMTGEFDNMTFSMMGSPRCGVPDMDPDEEMMTRRKRYDLVSKWPKLDLTYRIVRYTNHLDRDDTDEEITKAFKYWSDVTPLTFTATDFGAVDIVIQFTDISHGDGVPFDGPGGTLAHAYFPAEDPNYELAGDAHFDNSEIWTIDSRSGTNLLAVAVHEFGHSLGLGHSEVDGAIMWPWAKGYDPELSLDMDDIDGIQMLYGKPRDRTAPPGTRPPAPTPQPTTTTTIAAPTTTNKIDIRPCTRIIDAATIAANGEHYMFINNQVYSFNSAGTEVLSGFPKALDEVFHRGPTSVDAAVTFWARVRRRRYRKETYLFKNNLCWRYTVRGRNLRLERGYPKTISSQWGIDAERIDAAFTWSLNGGIYFTSGDTLWRHTDYRGIYRGYPVSISEHKYYSQLLKFQAAMTWWNDLTYFFVGDKYYRSWSWYEEEEFDGPWDTGYWWFSCRE